MSSNKSNATSLFELSANRLSGEKEALKIHQDKVVLVVNTASACGFTSQYAGLEDLYQHYKDKGLVVLGFPCNQFGAQEKGSSDEIQTFCQKNYGVSFPMYEKVEVNGDDTAPVFHFLKTKAPGLLGSRGIKWNFTKFLVNRQGDSVTRFSPQTKPEQLIGDIEKLL